MVAKEMNNKRLRHSLYTFFDCCHVFEIAMFSIATIQIAKFSDVYTFLQALPNFDFIGRAKTGSNFFTFVCMNYVVNCIL